VKETRIYIIGAGFAGEAIAEEIEKKGVLGTVVAFADDDPEKIGTTCRGIPILGPIDSLENVSTAIPAEEALIAIPSVSREELSRIYRSLHKAGFQKIRLLPTISQIIDGDAHLIQTREIDAQDFLPREPVVIPLKKSLEYLRGKRVLITGAGGSIGSELSRQLLSGGAERLYLLGHGENSIYEIDRELRILQEEGVGEKAAIVPVIGELLDRDYMYFILNRLKADVVFHCAAYKHVPMLEENPIEAIKNNVFGTSNLVDAASDSDTSRFVFISTDKAVNPVSIYGASKMIAEELVLSKKNGSKKFMVVRFGNVLGSRGSIIPLLRKQISKGGPVTVTHPETSRFFMTIPEASSLVLQAGGVGSGSSLYILEMGSPLNITDLAKQLITFHGFTPEVEIPIKYIGLRPGEKMTERLWDDDECPKKTKYPYINRVERKERFNGELDTLIENLRTICFFDEDEPALYRNRKELRRLLSSYIPAINELEDEPEY
jgi:FlaA1/EpsC-like NDP-sugar epimerase